MKFFISYVIRLSFCQRKILKILQVSFYMRSKPFGETDGNSRVVCIDKMYFHAKGFIRPVVITKEGIDRFNLKK